MAWARSSPADTAAPAHPYIHTALDSALQVWVPSTEPAARTVVAVRRHGVTMGAVEELGGRRVLRYDALGPTLGWSRADGSAGGMQVRGCARACLGAWGVKQAEWDARDQHPDRHPMTGAGLGQQRLGSSHSPLRPYHGRRSACPQRLTLQLTSPPLPPIPCHPTAAKPNTHLCKPCTSDMLPLPPLRPRCCKARPTSPHTSRA